MVLEYYLHKEYPFHLKSNSSVLFKNLSVEVSQFTTYFLTPIISIASDAMVFIGIFVFMIAIYPLIASFLFFIIGGLLIFSNLLLKKKINSYARGRNTYSEEFYKSALEALHAVKEIQVFSVYQHFLERFNKASRRYNENYIRFNIASNMPRHILETAIFTSVLLIILISAGLNKNYKEIIPMLTVAGIVSLRLLPLISKIATNLNAFHFSFNSTDIVFTIVRDYRVSFGEKSFLSRDIVVPQGSSNSIIVDNITFRYAPEAQPIIKDFNVTIPSGATTAFIGETGSGKSTLIDIIMGLLTPEKGCVYFGDIKISLLSLESFRQKIGYVPQNIFLADDRIVSNIAFGVPPDKIDLTMLNNAIKISQLESFINTLPEGVSTRIGERGVRISGGQRQRIGIARALYRNPDIIILDEATSALDVHTEESLYQAIKHLRKTIIIVTHRFSTLENADRIYLLDHGRILEQGTFSELSATSEFFRKIVKDKNRAPAEGYSQLEKT